MIRYAAVVLISLAIAAPGALAETWFVDIAVTKPGDGRSWSGAFRFLQDALHEPGLSAGDEIHVAAGTYLPDRFAGAQNGTGDWTESFDLRPGVAVYGGFPPGGGPFATRDPASWPAVLSGDILELPQDMFESCADPDGGAADCFTATPGITGCVNGSCCTQVCDQVPFCCVMGWDQQCADAAIDICDGRATVTALGIGQSIRLDGFTIRDGSAVGGPVVDPYIYYGGGMRAGYAGGPVVIANCTFVGNVAEHGGGLAITGGVAHVVNCRFEANEAFFGGAMYVTYADSTLANCLFTGNTASEGAGSGVYADPDSVVNLVNCTLVEDFSVSHGIAAYEVSEIANCIFWGNGSTPIYGAGSVAYTCVEGGHTGEENIDAVPLFADAGGGDYRLALDSPCRDAGDVSALSQDVADLDGDLQTDEPTPLDLQMARRVLDAAVDIGAYERCRYDLSGDGIVSIEDLLALLAAWTTDPGGPPDFDGSGDVGIDDFLELLANWTGCN